MSRRRITVSSSALKTAVSSLTEIAKNALNEEDRLINLMVSDNYMIVSATDSSREGQVEVQVNADFKEVFSVNVNKLNVALDNEGTTYIEVMDSIVLLKQGTNTIQLNKYKVNHKPFTYDAIDDIVKVNNFLKMLGVFTKYLTNELDSSGVIVFNNNLVYTRSKLFNIISNFKLNGFYIMDKSTCKIIRSALTSKRGKDMKISKDENGSKIIIKSENITLRVPMLRHEEIDLKRFIEIPIDSGYVINRDHLIKCVKEINAIDAPRELDIVCIDNVISIRPSIENSLTEYKITSQGLNLTGEVKKNFTYTVNSKALELLIKGLNTPNIIIISTQENMLVFLNEDEDMLIRYFILVY